MRSLPYLAGRVLEDIRASLLTSIASTIALTLCLFVLGVSFVIFTNADKFIPPIMTGSKAVVYLQPQTSSEEQENLARELGNRAEIESIVRVSKEEAQRRLASQLGEWKGILEGTGDNLLPSSLEISFKAGLKQTSDVETLLEKIRKNPLVDEISHGKGRAEKLISLLDTLKIGARWGMFFLGLAILLVSFNMIELKVRSRRSELEILNIVGASSFFTRMPFYLDAVTLAGVSSALAMGILFFTLRVLETVLPLPIAGALSLRGSEMLFVGAGVMGLGVLLSWLGSLLALRHL